MPAGVDTARNRPALTAEDATEKRAAIPFSPRVHDCKTENLSVLYGAARRRYFGRYLRRARALRAVAGAFDLCRLIEEKLQLERELAERKRRLCSDKWQRAFRTI